MDTTLDRVGADSGTVRWTKQDDRLWVGRSDRGCIGTIERGRAYGFLGLDGTLECTHRSLVDAQQSHARLGLRCDAPQQAARSALLLPAALAAVILTALFVLTAMVVL